MPFTLQTMIFRYNYKSNDVFIHVIHYKVHLTALKNSKLKWIVNALSGWKGVNKFINSTLIYILFSMAVTRVCSERTVLQIMQTFLFTFLKLFAKFRIFLRKKFENDTKFRFNLFHEKMRNFASICSAKKCKTFAF